MSTYPYAPLLPSVIPLRLSTAAMKYGMELGFAKGERSSKADQLADIVSELENRLLRDTVALDFQLEAVTR